MSKKEKCNCKENENQVCDTCQEVDTNNPAKDRDIDKGKLIPEEDATAIVNELKFLQQQYKELVQEKRGFIDQLTKIDEKMFKLQGSYEAYQKMLGQVKARK